jgi:uracil-DNA glycosylase
MNIGKLRELNKSIYDCTKCTNLEDTIGYPLPMCIGDNSDFSILVVGQNPGMAIRSNDVMWKAYSEKLAFDELLARYKESLRVSIIISFMKKYLQLDFDDLLWTNICKCVYKDNRAPTQEELQHGKQHLLEQLDIIKDDLKIIITLGKPAALALGISPKMQPEIEKVGSYNILPLFHPTFVKYGSLYDYINAASKVLHNFL